MITFFIIRCSEKVHDLVPRKLVVSARHRGRPRTKARMLGHRGTTLRLPAFSLVMKRLLFTFRQILQVGV